MVWYRAAIGHRITLMQVHAGWPWHYGLQRSDSTARMQTEHTILSCTIRTYMPLWKRRVWPEGQSGLEVCDKIVTLGSVIDDENTTSETQHEGQPSDTEWDYMDTQGRKRRQKSLLFWILQWRWKWLSYFRKQVSLKGGTQKHALV